MCFGNDIGDGNSPRNSLTADIGATVAGKKVKVGPASQYRRRGVGRRVGAAIWTTAGTRGTLVADVQTSGILLSNAYGSLSPRKGRVPRWPTLQAEMQAWYTSPARSGVQFSKSRPCNKLASWQTY